MLLLGLVLGGNAAAAEGTFDGTTWIGGDVNISEAVRGPLVAVGGDVRVTAPVSGRMHIAGGDVKIASSAPVTGDVNVAAGDLTVDGSINGNLHAAGGSVKINSIITGDASIAAGKLELGPAARIQGKLTFRGNDLRQDPAAQVVGGIERHEGSRHWHQHMTGERFLHGWLWTAGLMVLAAFIAAALPGASDRMARELRERPGVTLLLGLVSVVTIPVAAVLLMITIIGVPIGVLAILVYAVLLLVGYVWLAVIVGGMLLDRVKPQTTALAGWRVGMAMLAMLAIALLVRLPYVGDLTHFVAVVIGVGMIVAVMFRARPSAGALAA